MSKKKGGTPANWDKEEEPVQAVVIADSFNEKFAPVTKEIPRALLPVVNYVLLDYTLEYLIEQGVQEIFVFCCSHAERVRNHIRSSWSTGHAHCTIQTVMSSSEDCISLGDALREIDREGLIRTDFILVPGDIVATVDLKSIIQEHRVRRKKEKTLVMTLLYKVTDPGHLSRCLDEDDVVAMDPTTRRLLHFEQLRNSSKSNLPVSLFHERSAVQLRYDLSDSQIAICSPLVPPLFTDNFDYQTKGDFIRGILINEEILGNQIYCDVIDKGYACQVADLRLYNAVSLDIMNRWSYPQVPDSRTYRYLRHNVYLDDGVILARDCNLQQNVTVGSKTSIGEGTTISRSVLGRNCVVGKNVKIINSFLWDDVTIEDDCVIEQSLLCNGCRVNRSVQLKDTVLSYNVKIGPDVSMEGKKFTALKIDDEDGFGEVSPDHKGKEDDTDALLGSKGHGFLYTPIIDEDDESILPSLAGMTLADADDESSDESVMSDGDSILAEPVNVFYGEVVENVRHGLADNIAIDNIILEVNASKYKHNVTITEINQSVVKAVVEVVVGDFTLTKQEMPKELNQVTSKLTPLLANYIKGKESQMDALVASEDYFAQNMDHASLFASYLHKLYELDILDEAIILKWHGEEPQMEGLPNADAYTKLRRNPTLQKFISWLEEAEEESDDEEE